MVTGRRRPGLARLHAEPARLWIVYSPRVWPGGEAPWTDLAAGRLRALKHSVPAEAAGEAPPGAVSEAWPVIDGDDLDDLLYLPPVAADRTAERDRWAGRLVESETPVLIQLAPGEETEASEATAIYDLLRPLLAGALERLARLPAGADTVWPLIPGLTDSTELMRRGCDLLARAGVASVQPLAVELTAGHRRLLVELAGEGAFDALFHGASPPERDFARLAADRGLSVFLPRPPAPGPPRRSRNRRLATDLALAGELWLRLGRSVGDGQALLRAARGAEDTRRDLTALVREGNLGVLDWLDARSVDLVAEVTATDRSSLLESLLQEYVE